MSRRLAVFGWMCVIGLSLTCGPIKGDAKDLNDVSNKPRIVVTTDLGADPDDEQSLVRLLVSANEFDIEGLVVSTSCWKKKQSDTVMLDRIVDAYGKVLPNLIVHAKGYPSHTYLRSVSVLGQAGYGMDDVGDGKDSKGSDLIIAAVDKSDPRPVWIQLWGGGNTLAQAIWKVRATRSPAELHQFLSKVRVFDILGQDEAGAWMVKNFPDIFYIRATDVYGWQPPKNGTYQRQDIQSHGALGAVYPDTKWATEGDTPAFLHMFPNGLNDAEKIDQAGWGGRFSFEKRAGIRSMSEVAKINPQAETQYDPYLMYGNAVEKGMGIRRWSSGYDHDFAARMDWSITSRYQDANHHPVVVLNGDRSRKGLEMAAAPGARVRLDASESSDPDKDTLAFAWTADQDASSFKGKWTLEKSDSVTAEFVIPSEAVGKSIHVILEVHDNGRPALYAYRRVIIQVR